MDSSEETSLTRLHSWFTNSTVLDIEVVSNSVEGPGVIKVKAPGVVFTGEGIISETGPIGYIKLAVGASGSLILRLSMEDIPVLDPVSGTITLSSHWGSCVLKPKALSVSDSKSEVIQ